MQVSGTFPELYAGRSKARPAKKLAKPEPRSGMAGFAIKGRAKQLKPRPDTYAGRRAAAHAKAYKD